MSKKHSLHSYKGLLNAEEIAAGMNAAITNANRLYEDAYFLFQKQRYPSALSLAILSIEESGKLSILRGIALCKESDKVTKEWRRYRSHRSKNGMWIFKDLVLSGARNIDEFEECINDKGRHTADVDALKQIGFYTDCLGNKNWSKPDEVIDEETASSFLQIAKLLKEKKEVSVREVELWVKHLQEGPNSKVAVRNFFVDMINEGLMNDNIDNIDKFLGFDFSTKDCL